MGNSLRSPRSYSGGADAHSEFSAKPRRYTSSTLPSRHRSSCGSGESTHGTVVFKEFVPMGLRLTWCHAAASADRRCRLESRSGHQRRPLSPVRTSVGLQDLRSDVRGLVTQDLYQPFPLPREQQGVQLDPLQLREASTKRSPQPRICLNRHCLERRNSPELSPRSYEAPKLSGFRHDLRHYATVPPKSHAGIKDSCGFESAHQFS